MLLFFDKIKKVMHSSSLQLKITMFRVALSYLLSVISITHDECVIAVINTTAKLTLQNSPSLNDPAC